MLDKINTQPELKWFDDKLWRYFKYIVPPSTFIMFVIVIVFFRDDFSIVALYIMIIFCFILPIIDFWLFSMVYNVRAGHYSLNLQFINIQDFLSNLEKELTTNKLNFNKKEHIKEWLIKFRYFYEVDNGSLHIRLEDFARQDLRGNKLKGFVISVGKVTDTNVFMIVQLKKIVETALTKTKK